MKRVRRLMPDESLLCPVCETPVDPGREQHCPKCGESLRGRVMQGLLEADVAHSGETWAEAREKILAAVDRGILHGHRGVKIIHGWGARTGRAAIADEAVRLLKSLSAKTGGRLAPDRGNPGAHILWLNR